MNKLLRAIDANLNRVSEGLRVLEDLSRFYDDDPIMARTLRTLRHRVRKGFDLPDMMAMRQVKGDVGLKLSQTTDLDHKSDIQQLKTSNMKRVQEGLRSIEEHLKVLGETSASKYFELLRFECYDLEQKLHRNFKLSGDIYLILGEAFSKGRTNRQVMVEALEAGVRMIQYREKEKSKKEQLSECRDLVQLAKAFEAIFIVNDHVDIAISVGAHGVHLGQEDMPIEDIRRIAPSLIIGRSTHNMVQVEEALVAGADYIGVGPIYPTQTKSNLEACDGIGFLEQVSRRVKIPYVAIGGIKADHVNQITRLGAACAMISEIVGAENISDKIREIKEIIDGDVYNADGCR